MLCTLFGLWCIAAPYVVAPQCEAGQVYQLDSHENLVCSWHDEGVCLRMLDGTWERVCVHFAKDGTLIDAGHSCVELNRKCP
jgi:hypothetical protein